MYTYLSLATCVSAHIRSLHVVVLPVYVVVFSSRCGWWKAPPVSPATSSKVQKVTVAACFWFSLLIKSLWHYDGRKLPQTGCQGSHSSKREEPEAATVKRDSASRDSIWHVSKNRHSFMLVNHQNRNTSTKAGS